MHARKIEDAIITPITRKSLRINATSIQRLNNDLLRKDRDKCDAILIAIKKQYPAKRFDKGAAKLLYKFGYFTLEVVRDVASADGTTVNNVISNLNVYRSIFAPVIKALGRTHTKILMMDASRRKRIDFKRFMGKKRERKLESPTPYTYVKIVSGGLPGLGKRK